MTGTNRLGVFPLSPDDQTLNFGTNNFGTNRFAAIRLEPVTVGTNRVLQWRLDNDPALTEQAQKLPTVLVTMGPAAGFFTAFQVALYGGAVLASPFIFYFVAAFIFPALKLKERHYVYRGLGFGL